MMGDLKNTSEGAKEARISILVRAAAAHAVNDIARRNEDLDDVLTPRQKQTWLKAIERGARPREAAEEALAGKLY